MSYPFQQEIPQIKRGRGLGFIGENATDSQKKRPRIHWVRGVETRHALSNEFGQEARDSLGNATDSRMEMKYRQGMPCLLVFHEDRIL